MRGTKRQAISDSTPVFNSNDSFMQNKRVLTGSLFGANKAETSIRQPTLDAKRAESSRQHVRALNTQFASWVQTQLKDHPEELWEDGVNDYLNHAKSIMEKFSDVVNWLKENAAKGGSSDKRPSDDAQTKPAFEIDKSKPSFLEKPMSQAKPAFEIDRSKPSFLEKPMSQTKPAFEIDRSKPSFLEKPMSQAKPAFEIDRSKPSYLEKPMSQTKPAFEIDKSNHNLFLEKPMFPAATTANSGPSWSSGSLFSNNNNNNNNNNSAPFSFGGLSGSQVSVFGNANAVTTNHTTSNEAEGEDDIEQPGSPSVKKSQEEGIVVVHEVKCKLYVKSSDPADNDAWKDKGMGQLSIRCKEGISKGTKESKPTIVIRNDVGKLLLNALIYQGIKTNVQKNSVVSIFHTSDDGDNNDNVVARTFLMRTKTEEDRDKLVAAIQEHAPAS